MPINNKIISAHLLFSLMVTFGCDPDDNGDALELAEHELDASPEPNEQNIVIPDEEYTEDPSLAREYDIAAAPNASEGPAGKCCYAECYDGIDAWYLLSWISADCNGKAQAWCASHNWGLKNAEWFYC